MRAGKLFAADLGASGGKLFAGIFGKNGFTLQEVHRFEHEGVSFFLDGGNGTVRERTYWDDIFLYNQILEGLRKFRQDISDKLDGIGIDTWGSDGQFVTPDGDILGKVYCYRDHRLDNMMEVLREQIEPQEIFDITGIHFEKFNISFQLLWFMRNRAETLQPGSEFLPMPSLFYYYLGNIKMVDATWASVTQLMDARSRKWSQRVCQALGIPIEVLPSIVSPGTVAGSLTPQLADSLSLNRAPLMAVASHDTASAYTAAPVEKEEEALVISSGTWSLVGKMLPQPITGPEAMHARLSNEGGVECIRLLTNCMGSWPVQELRRGWRVEDGGEMTWDEITGLVEKAAPFTAFIDPDHASFYNPAHMDEAVREYCRSTGQTVPRDRASILRTVFESLALAYRRVNENICDVSDTQSSVVHILGGGCRNQVLNQFTADATGLPVIAGPEEASAMGNILMQAEAAGLVDDRKQARAMMQDACGYVRYKPRDRKSWEDAYRRFLDVTGSGKA